MKLLILLTISFSFVSCSLKDAIDNDFQTKSRIDPFAESTSLEKRYQKTTIKIPLTESTVGHFDREYVLENDELDSRKKGFFRKLMDKFKYGLYSIAIGLGVSNKIRYRTYYNFESIDPELLKSAKITKVFFTTEDCRPEEQYCNGSKRITSNFNFVESFFVNVSNYSHAETEGALEVLDAQEFQEIARRSFEQTAEELDDKVFDVEDNTVDLENSFEKVGANEINLVKFSSNVPDLSLEDVKLPLSGSEFTIKLRDSQDHKNIRGYLRSDKFKKVFRKVSFKRRPERMVIRTQKGVSLEEAYATLKKDQNFKVTSKMIIFRLNSKYIETKKYFQQSKFNGIVKDMTPIGRSLFIELTSMDAKEKFDQIVKADKSYIDRNLDVYKVEKCENKNCLDLDVKAVNLVPMLEVNPKFKIDSYISIRSLGKIDFKYNGFIEIELDLSLPL